MESNNPSTAIKNNWDNYSKQYNNTMGNSTKNLMSILLSLARVNKKPDHLIIACGPGLETQLALLEVPSKNSNIYSTDISPKMIELAMETQKNNEDFLSNPNNHFEFVEYKDEGKNYI